MGAWDFETLKEHIGHKIVCAGYWDKDEGEIINVAVECLDCCEVLMDYDKYPEEEEG